MQVGPGSPRGATFGKLGSLVQSPQERTQQEGGRGEEGNGRQGLERQLGELKYADGEMCECLGKGKTRITGSEGAAGADSEIYPEWGLDLPSFHPSTFTLPGYPEPGLQGLGSKL